MTGSSPIFCTNFLPVLLPAITALIILLTKIINNSTSRRTLWFIAVIGVVWTIFIGPGVVKSSGTGDLPASSLAFNDYISPFGSLIILISLLLSLLLDYTKARERKNLGTLLSLVLLATSGCIAFSSATHLVVLILGIEVFYFPLCTIAAFDHHDRAARKSGLTFLILGLLVTGLMVFGAALYYAGAGTLSLREISVPPEGRLPFSVGSILILATLLLKGFYLPFMAWNKAADNHGTQPSHYLGLMPAMSGTATFLILVRLVPEIIMHGGSDSTGPVLLIIAVASIFVGCFMAMSQANAKRAISYIAIAHAGYMLIGLVALRSDASGGVLFHLALWGPSLITAFYLVGFVSSGEHTGELAGLIGAGYRWTLPSVVLLFMLLSIAGLPPTGGFVSEIMIFLGAAHSGLVWSVIFALLVNLAGIFACLRIIVYMYMKRLITPRPFKQQKPPGIPESIAYLLAGTAVIAAGIAPAALIYLASLAAGSQ